MGGDYNPYSTYCCPHDKLRCKRVDWDGFPACFIYNMNGRLRFVCRRFVVPDGFTLPKQLSPEQIKDICTKGSCDLNPK